MALVQTRYAVRGWGVGEFWRSNRLVVAHDFRFGSGVAAPEDDDDDLVERFRAFLTGRADDFADVELDLGWTTMFQRELARTLRRVPRGEVVSYGELAALVGRRGAARAAGAFCASNRFALLVPCHRVVAAHGIGGYGDAGVEVKRRLLALEGVSL